ncbi:MAG: 16S rRNA (adenine(1518)-N(6)/adenine(1519)-N(6))-dimethyltransferase RsmA [Candidatus Bathyarchaeota archaeon]|nr:16S rRNA (adenine(1518)-N(6)/adenine(1519)-N(6))-dimethyltransferase RsmA [Candidatus Bathyarchaeota archaeon]
MSLEETKQLLRAYRITPNKLLGQNFMVEPSLYARLCSYAELESSDVVLDAGAGFGFLTRFLADKCRAVVAVEKDPQVAKVLCEQVGGLGNVSVIVGDVLKAPLPPFNKVIAIPPYYLSSQFVTWLFERRIDCAVLIVQKEFAQRLVAEVGSEEYGWLMVVGYQHAEVALLDIVPKEMFYPRPEVDSVIISLKPWKKKAFEVLDEALFLRLVKWLFTERNKKLSKALVPFLRSNYKLSKLDAEKLACSLPLQHKRVRELAPKDFGAILDALPS